MATGNLETLTLEFDNARAVQALYGGDDKLLRDLEAALDVRVTSRDGWLRIEGGEDGVLQARKVFEQLDEARKRGVVIPGPSLTTPYAAGRNGGTELGRLLDLRIQTSSRKPPIVPKTDGQKAYILAMQSRDITFGIGPAGTGKTYLAVALAVSAP